MSQFTTKNSSASGLVPELDTSADLDLEPKQYLAIPVVQLIGDLERGAALTGYQAKLLLDGWNELPDDWASSPYLCTVREHTRAYIDRLRHQMMSTPVVPEATP
jgi:hypothetical protein